MKHKVSELEGVLLDTAVAMIERDWFYVTKETTDPWLLQHPAFAAALPCWFTVKGDAVVAHVSPKPKAYSTRWQIGGPILDRDHISVEHATLNGRGAEGWFAFMTTTAVEDDTITLCHPGKGPTALIAGMRAYVASKFGEEVELP